MKIGFIGVGVMGSRMAKRLMDARYELVVYDIRKEATSNLLEKGAVWVDTPEEVAKVCEVVFTSLPGPKEVDEVVYGEKGLLAGWKSGDIFIDTTTTSPSSIRSVAEDAKNKGVAVLDAPLGGSTKEIELGTLTFYVGGGAQVLKKIRKILESIGPNIFHVGDIGCGNIVKLISNMLANACNAATAEAFILGTKAGIDVRILHDVLKASHGRNWWLETRYPETVFQRNFDPGFRITLAVKDIGLAVALAREHDVPQPVNTAVAQKFIEAKAAGYGDMNGAAIICPQEKLHGIEVHPE